MGLGQLRGPSWEAGTLLHCTTQKSLFALGGMNVCDSAHGLIVMKKIRVRAGSQRQRARAPAPHIREKRFVRKGGIPGKSQSWLTFGRLGGAFASTVQCRFEV